MKKVLLAVLSLSFLVGGASFVNAKDNPYKDMKKSFEEMNTLVEKYNKASDKKKPAIEKQIKEKVAANYEKQIKNMEERTAQLEERVAKMKEEIAKMKTEEEKTQRVDKVTKEILEGKKPMLFNPPWAKDGQFGKHHGGMKGLHHHGKMKCGCKEGKKCPFHKGKGEGEQKPPMPPVPSVEK